MSSSSLSGSVVKRGQSRENEQQAPQLRQGETGSGGVAALLLLAVVKTCTHSSDSTFALSAELSLRSLPSGDTGRREDVDHIGMESSKRRAAPSSWAA
jgi:hypothetical protein